MLRITEENTPQGHTRLRLEGRLMGVWVAVLRQSGANVAAASLTLDLVDVSYADEEGLALLLEWQAGGAQLHNVLPLLREMLKLAAMTVHRSE